MKNYPSKISFGLVFFILVILVATTMPMISPPIWSGLIINLLVLTFVAHLFTSTYYVLDGSFLEINSSFLVHKKIAVGRIRKIAETNSPISAPAASFDRLEIIYDEQGSILISPKDKAGFIEHITQINPQIEVHFKSKTKANV